MGGLLGTGAPLYCVRGGEVYFPALRLMTHEGYAPFRDSVMNRYYLTEGWKWGSYDERPIFAIIPFDAGEVDTLSVGSPPGKRVRTEQGVFIHYLGTDLRGRDVLAGLVAGAGLSLWAGFLVVLVALLIGFPLGLLAGYFGDGGLVVPRGRFWGILLGFFVGSLVGMPALLDLLVVTWEGVGWSMGILVFFGALGFGVGWILDCWLWNQRRVNVPFDILVMRLAEVVESVPKLLILLSMVGVLGAGVGTNDLLIVLGLLSWPGVVFYVRAAVMRTRGQLFVDSARGVGMSSYRLLVWHILPLSVQPVLTVAAAGIGGAILAEASLSYLIPGSMGVSWGSMLAGGSPGLAYWWTTLPVVLVMTLLFYALVEVVHVLAVDRYNS
jgi:ABC-type dipeptide/oligopeptide/nickel transport system permease subunit